MTSRMLSRISIGSCSTQPARGMICSCSFWPTEMIEPFLSKTIARLEVVPWSRAMM